MIDSFLASRYARMILLLALLAGTLLVPAWMILGIAALVAIFVPLYVEFLVLVIVIEALYHAIAPFATGIWLPGSLILFFLVLEASRDYVRERVLRL
jgi:hypothetical protein